MQALTAQNVACEGQIRAFMADRGFLACDSLHDIEQFRVLAKMLIPGEIASLAVLQAVQQQTGLSLFLLRRENAPASFIAIFPLSPAGERAILAGGFDGIVVQPQWVAPFNEHTRAGYVWGLGGMDRAAGYSAMKALRIMRKLFFAHVRLYARASTPQGRKLMQGFGCVSLCDCNGVFCASAELASAPARCAA